jgi:hypothetical protein
MSEKVNIMECVFCLPWSPCPRHERLEHEAREHEWHEFVDSLTDEDLDVIRWHCHPDRAKEAQLRAMPWWKRRLREWLVID